jgi:hypothetical protein
VRDPDPVADDDRFVDDESLDVRPNQVPQFPTHDTAPCERHGQRAAQSRNNHSDVVVTVP